MRKYYLNRPPLLMPFYRDNRYWLVYYPGPPTVKILNIGWNGTPISLRCDEVEPTT